MSSFYTFIKILIWAAFCRASLIGTTVVTNYATYTGITSNSTGITSFLGVRYAEAPIGDLRWRAPVSPPTTPLGNVDATQFRTSCIAATQTTVSSGTSEDCLFGNIYIPSNTSTEDRLPVVVFFHGGGFEGGSSHDYSADGLIPAAAKPMIFIAFDYRLGQFGFLGGSAVKSNGDLNAGLLDQRAALQWIQTYITLFGGDPSRVTIWGQSAGAGSTMFHLVAYGGNSSDLFQAAMGDSPSLSYMPHYTDTGVEQLYTQFVTAAGCNNATDEMACLRTAESNTLAAAGSETLSQHTATLYIFAPILDDAFFLERTVEAFHDGNFAHVPVFFGSNTDEGAGWSASLSNSSANTSSANATEDTVYNFLQGQFGSFTRASFDTAVQEYYPLDQYNSSLSLQGQQMYGEMRYICSAVLVTGGAFSGQVTAYQYHYDNAITGSGHSAELSALFPSSVPSDPTVATLFASIREYWTSFITDGEPAAADSASWTAVSQADSSQRLHLTPSGSAMENLTDDLLARCTFWHSISAEVET